jgi:hypothetical protein
MMIVEEYSQTKTMSSWEKAELAKSLAPVIVEVLHENGFIDDEQRDEGLRVIEEGSFYMDIAIPLLIEISKNPHVLQAKKYLGEQFEEAKETKCWGWCGCC